MYGEATCNALPTLVAPRKNTTESTVPSASAAVAATSAAPRTTGTKPVARKRRRRSAGLFPGRREGVAGTESA